MDGKSSGYYKGCVFTNESEEEKEVIKKTCKRKVRKVVLERTGKRITNKDIEQHEWNETNKETGELETRCIFIYNTKDSI